MSNFVSYQRPFFWKCPACGHKKNTIGYTPDPPTSWKKAEPPTCDKCGTEKKRRMF